MRHNRWFWWSILAACLMPLAIYLIGLAFNRIEPEKSLAKARLVLLSGEKRGARHAV
jgi:hypothetical protein